MYLTKKWFLEEEKLYSYNFGWFLCEFITRIIFATRIHVSWNGSGSGQTIQIQPDPKHWMKLYIYCRTNVHWALQSQKGDRSQSQHYHKASSHFQVILILKKFLLLIFEPWWTDMAFAGEGLKPNKQKSIIQFFFLSIIILQVLFNSKCIDASFQQPKPFKTSRENVKGKGVNSILLC